MKKILRKTLGAVTFNCMVGLLIAFVSGFSPLACVAATNGAALLMGSGDAWSGSLRVGVLKEVWTGEMVKALRAGLEATWLEGIPDSSSLVDNDVIHLVDVGVDPDVLINNTTYPIPLQALDDKDITISLDKFQTKVTPITDDELYAISYQKMARVKESHANSINDAKFAKAAHALSPTENTKITPVLKTTGDYVDGTSGRRKLTMQDIINLKAAFDNLKIPATGRRLVLCSDHVNDILSTSQSFREQYSIDRANGTVGRQYGFDIYEFVNNPIYTTAGKKKELGATASAGEFQVSFAFYMQRIFKATGSTKMYYSDATTDPEYQRNKINFRHYFICMPKKMDACGVIMSDYLANG